MMATFRATVLVVALLVFVPSVRGLGTTVLEGDVYIQVIGRTYRKLHENGTCSELDHKAVQNIEAVRWILEKLNDDNYIPGLTKGIGLRLSETCGSVTNAETLALQLAAELESGTSSDVVGVIGPGECMESQAISRLLSSLPRQHRLLQMEYGTSSTSLTDRETYNNVFLTLPADNVQIKAMVSTLQKLRWTYMAIIFEDSEYGRGLKDALLEETQSRDMCFPVNVAVDMETSTRESLAKLLGDKMLNASVPVSGAVVLGGRQLAEHLADSTELVKADFPKKEVPVFLFSESSEYADGFERPVLRGGFVLSPPNRDVEDFKEHLSTLIKSETELSKLPEQYKAKLVEIENSGPSIHNHYAIQTGLIMAKVVQTVCSSQGGCGQMKQVFIDTISTLQIDFDDDFPFRISTFKNLDPKLAVGFSEKGEITQPPGLPLYEVYNFQTCGTNNSCVERVAYLTSDQFSFSEAAIHDYDRQGRQLSWPNIRKAQCPSGFTCTTCLQRQRQRQGDAVLYEQGDMYVVGIVPVHNPGSSPLQCAEIKSGGLDIVESIRFAIHDATDRFASVVPNGKIGLVVIDSCNDPQIIQEKLLNLHRYGVLQHGQYVPISDKIIGYVGGWSSDVSTAVASITSRLGIVQIAYASTAPRLSDTQLYPYFLRTPTPDDAQATTLLRLVEHFKSNLIQILYSETAYGEGGRDAVRELSSKLDVCIAQAVGVRRQSKPADTINALRKHPDAKVVVCFLGSFEIEPLVKSLNNDLGKHEFIFISSEGWGTRVDVSGFPNLVGSITLTCELPVNQKIKDHLKDLNPSEAGDNPWLREYMERHFECFYEWSMDKQQGSPCKDTNQLDSHDDYTIDVWSSFAERAVLSLLQGAKLALDKLCSSSAAVCQQFRDEPNVLFNETKMIEFRDEGGTTKSRAFDDNGDGLAGYKIYVVDDDNRYKRIGASDVETFTFDESLYPKSRVINSTCGDQEYCRVCFKKTSSGEDNDLPIIWIAAVSALGFICVVLTIYVLCVYRKLGCCLTLDNGRVKMNATYLTPMHIQRRKTRMGPDGFEEEYDSITDTRRQTAPANDYITADLTGFDNPPRTGVDGAQDAQQYI